LSPWSPALLIGTVRQIPVFGVPSVSFDATSASATVSGTHVEPAVRAAADVGTSQNPASLRIGAYIRLQPTLWYIESTR
jgi:hypothetical protein